MCSKLKQRTCWTALVGACMMAAPTAALACERCFGAAVDSPATAGIQMAMLTLLGTVGFVGGGIVLFFVKVRRRMTGLEPGSLVVTEKGELLSAADALPHEKQT